MGRLGFVSRGIFAILILALALLAAGLLIYAGLQVSALFGPNPPDIGTTLLSAVGYTVVSLAVFEVAKFLLEEEVIHPSEMRYTGEARRGMTKFMATIAIAVFLEALVLVFAVGKDDPALMLYPTLLLLAGVALVVGLGVYQRLSVAVEKAVGGVRGEARAEAEAEAEAEANAATRPQRRRQAAAEATEAAEPY